MAISKRPEHIPGSFIAAGFVLLLLLANASAAFAASTISISPAGEGVFALQGIGIEGASALEINVAYDTATLVNPRVAEGAFIAGAMTAINTNHPGIVRIVAIRIAPIRGSGLIATVTFQRTGSSSGKILSLSVKLAGATGAPLTALAQVVNPAEALPDSSPSSQAHAQSGGTPPATIIVAPTVSPAVPAPPPAGGETPPDTPASPEPATDPPAPAALPEVARGDGNAKTEDSTRQTGETAAPGRISPPKLYAPKSVLDRFREYKGPRNADAFIALFDQENMIGWKQHPAIAIADGKTAVSVSTIMPPGLLTLSDIRVTGAQLVSLTRDADNTNTWIIKLLPRKGASQATITVARNDFSIVYPVIVAPKATIKRKGAVTKAVFEQFFRPLAGAAARPDLSGDGLWDAVDDYILTANYLHAVNRQKK